MSGAGDVKNRELELAAREAGKSSSPQNSTVRFYCRNGVTWTVHRPAGDRPRGLKALLSRIREWLRK